jgi:ketosteroid isomerase-like protein
MAFIGALEDRVAIRELLEAYADAVCVVDADAWGATWAEDGVWELPDYPEIGKITGKANIVAAWTVAMAHYPGIIFVSTPGSIVVTGDQAVVRSYTSEVFDDQVSGKTTRDRGRYDDLVVRRNGQWLFKTRCFKKLHREG